MPTPPLLCRPQHLDLGGLVPGGSVRFAAWSVCVESTHCLILPSEWEGSQELSDACFLAEEREEVTSSRWWQAALMREKEAFLTPVAHSDPWEMMSDSVSDSRSWWGFGTPEARGGLPAGGAPGASGWVGRSRARAQAGRAGLCGPEQPALACASTGPGTDMLTT